MSTVVFLLRAQRARLRSWLSLALLLALVGGAVLAVGAGARRTDSAYARFIASANTSDVFIGGNDMAPAGTSQPVFERIAKLPQVAQVAGANFLVAAISLPSGRLLTIDTAQPVGFADRGLGRTIDRFKVLQGRLADPDNPGEANVSFPFADNLQVHVGDTIVVRPLQLDRLFQGQPPVDAIVNKDDLPFAVGKQRSVRVVGIVASPIANDFPPLTTYANGAAYFTPAFLRANAANLSVFSAIAVKLRHGAADLPGFQRDAERLANGQQVQFLTPQEHLAVVESSLHLQAQGLGILGALAAVVLLLVAGQGVARRIALDATDHGALHALGATRAQLWTAAMARAGLAALAGAVGAVVVAIALSPLTPLGTARLAEPDPGVALDAWVVLGGAAALVLLVLLLAAVPAWRNSGSRASALSDGGDAGGGRRHSRVAEALSRAGFAATAVTGVRLALEPGRGRSAVPVRSASTAGVLAVATVAAALCFTASLGHLLDTPRLYGWNWDAEVANAVQTDVSGRALAARPWVGAVAAGTFAEVGVGGDRATATAMDSAKGDIGPAVLSGRAPQGPGEILLGTQTDAGARLGELVTVHVGAETMRLRLVGRGVLPVLSDTSRLGIGAWMAFGDLQHLLGQGGAQHDTLLVRFSGGLDQGAAQMRRLFGVNGVVLASRPSGLVGFGDLSALPVVLGGVLAAGGVATLAHAVLTSVQRRRRELAVLKTLGFVRGQVAATVAWQTTTIAAIAALIGVPLGAAAGRWAWTLFAAQQGLVSEPVLPVPSLLLLVPGALLLGNIVAAIPGRFAARTSPALVLRAE